MANGTVEALFPYSYEAGDGRTIAFSTGDRFTLLNKTNGDWWQVRKGSEKPMYVPASYMKEITIPVYENIENFERYRPYNGETVTSEENGQTSESRDNETESNGGESATPDCNEDRLDLDSENRGSESTEESSVDTSALSNESNGIRSAPSSVKSLAKSLELVSFDLVCLHRAWMCRTSVLLLYVKALLFVTLFDKSTISIAKAIKRMKTWSSYLVSFDRR